MPVKDFVLIHTNSSISNSVDIPTFELVLKNLDFRNLSKNDVKVLMYIGSSCVRNLKLSSKTFLQMFTPNETVNIVIDDEEYNYLRELN